MERIIRDSSALGATALRWNGFLKGLDFEFEEVAPGMSKDTPSHVRGLKVGCLGAVRDAFDQAAKYGVLLQVYYSRRFVERHPPQRVASHVGTVCHPTRALVQLVLSTAHFLRFGYGGPDFELHGITNRQRVANLHLMLSSEEGIAAYLKVSLVACASYVRVARGMHTRPTISNRIQLHSETVLLLSAVQ